MDCIVHGVAKSQTQLSDFHLLHSDLLQIVLQSPGLSMLLQMALVHPF